MRGKWRAAVVLVSVLSLLAMPLAATADEGTDGADPPSISDLAEWVYDSLVHVLVYGFSDPAAPDPLDCTLPDGVTVELDDDGQVVVSGGELPEGCSALNTEGPNGQVNHGTIVSALVHAIRAATDGETPFGRLLRGFAKSDLGKGDDQVKGANESQELETAGPADETGGGWGRGKGHDKSGHGKGHGKKAA